MYALFILSGYIKPYLSFFGLLKIDFNLLTGFFLLTDVLINIVRYKKVKRFENYQSIGLLLFLFFCSSILFSLLYTKSEKYYLSKLLSFGVCVVSYMYPIIIYRFNMARFFTIFSNISLLITGLFIIIYYITLMIIPFSKLLSFQDSYLIIGFLCGLNILFYFVGFNNSLPKLILFCIILIFTSARGPLLYTLLIVALIIIRNFFKTNLKINFKTIFYSFLLIFTFTVLNSQSQFSSDMVDKTVSRILVLFSIKEKGGRSAEARIKHINQSIKLISDKPILGYGFASYGFVTSGKDIRSYPHNSAIEIWFELGVLGIISFFLFILFHIIKSIHRYDSNAGILIVYLMLNSLISNTFSELKIEFCFLAIFLLKNEINFRKVIS